MSKLCPDGRMGGIARDARELIRVGSKVVELALTAAVLDVEEPGRAQRPSGSERLHQQISAPFEAGIDDERQE